MKHKDNNKKHFTFLDDLLYCECGTIIGIKIKKQVLSNKFKNDQKIKEDRRKLER